MRLKKTIKDYQITCFLYDHINVAANTSNYDLFNREIVKGRLIVDYNKDPDSRYDLTISSWYIDKDLQHLGYGKKLLKEVFKDFKREDISRLKYIWNGSNNYVGKWLDKFGAECYCPLGILKASEEDTWENHLYKLDIDKFMNYIERI